MIANIFLMIAGLLLVAKGGDLFVDSNVRIARVLGIPRIVIGGTLVSILTTMPEMMVSVTASWMGDSGIAVGNAVGSAIANIGLIVGTVAFLTPVTVDLDDFRSRAKWMLGAAVLVIVFCWDLRLNRVMAGVLLLVAFVYLVADFLAIRKHRIEALESGKDDSSVKISFKKELMISLLGAILVIAGSRFLVTSGISVAKALGIPSVIIGLSVVAVGTSLPELVTGVTAARKGVPDLSVGNIVGANVLNLALIIGISGSIHPLSLSTFTRTYSFPWLMIFVVLMILMIGKSGKIDKKEGAVLLGLYGAYLLGLIFLPRFLS